MGIYCTQTDVQGYVEDLVIDDPAALEREIERAERDLDSHVFTAYPPPLTPGQRRLVPGELDAVETDQLNRACCAQTEYRLEMGPEHFIRAQRTRTSRRGTTLEGALPRIGPKVWEELQGSTLLKATTRVGGRSIDPREAGWHGDLD